jgi:hypothetical protein
MTTKAQYLFRYFNAAGGVLRLHLKPCASDAEALAVMTAAPQDHESFEISRNDTVIWSGPRVSAQAPEILLLPLLSETAGGASLQPS